MSGARILVVDDDPAIVRSVRRALEARDYSVRTLSDGLEVLPVLREFRPEAILLDLVLPGADGIAVCRMVRAESTVPILLLSAIGDDAKKVEALDEGADDYVTKPFSMAELLARLRVHLRRSAGNGTGRRAAESEHRLPRHHGGWRPSTSDPERVRSLPVVA